MDDFSLFSSDAFNRVLERLGLGYRRHGGRVRRRVLVVWLLTWPPVAVLAAFAGVAIGPTPRQTFLFDLAAYAQLCLGLPLLLGAEPLIDEHIGRAVGVFWSSGLLSDDRGERFARNMRWAAAASRWWIVDVVLVVLAYVSVAGWLGEELGNGVATWHTRLAAGGETLTPAGVWDGLFSVPLFLYVMYRWIWKVALWFWVLWRASRVRLRLVVTHPDRAGGLGFLGNLQGVFGLLIFAVGSVTAATVGHKLAVEGASFYTYGILAPLVGFAIAAPVLFLLPLCFFSMQLYRAREEGLLKYSPLASLRARHLESRFAKSEHRAVLDTPEPVATVVTAEEVDAMYERVENMRIVPFDLETVRGLVVTSIGPMIPLLSSQVPGLKRVFELFG